MTTHEILVGARNLIAEEGNWWGGGGGSAHTARRVCAALAIEDASPDLSATALRPTFGALLGKSSCDPREVFAFNDSHSHAEVLAAFDRAIAATAPQPDLSFLTDPERVAA